VPILREGKAHATLQATLSGWAMIASSRPSSGMTLPNPWHHHRSGRSRIGHGNHHGLQVLGFTAELNGGPERLLLIQLLCSGQDVGH